MRNYWGLGVGHIYSHGESTTQIDREQIKELESAEDERESQSQTKPDIFQTADEIEENAENKMDDEERFAWEVSGDEDGGDASSSEQGEESDREFVELHDTYSSGQ